MNYIIDCVLNICFSDHQFIDFPYSFLYWNDGVPGGVNIFYIVSLSLLNLIDLYHVMFCLMVRECFDPCLS